jgi:hypothetical protein
MAANGIDIEGDVAFDEGLPRKVALRHAKWERTDIAAVVTILPGDDGLAVDVSGASLDARETFSGMPSDRKRADMPAKPTKPAQPKNPDDAVTPIKLQARVVQAWLTDDGAVTDVTAAMERDRHYWRQVRIDAKVGEGKPVAVEMHPDGQSRTNLKLTSTDAGAVLRDLDVYPDLVGGTLSIEGSYDDTTPRRPLTGVGTIKDFHIVHAQALLRLLNAAALVDTANQLNGQGIGFTTLLAPFTYTDDGMLTLRDNRSYGPALGLTVHGLVNLESKTLDL